MRNIVGWIILLIIGMILLTTGIRGQVGSAIGAIVTPNDIIDSGN